MGINFNVNSMNQMHLRQKETKAENKPEEQAKPQEQVSSNQPVRSEVDFMEAATYLAQVNSTQVHNANQPEEPQPQASYAPAAQAVDKPEGPENASSSSGDLPNTFIGIYSSVGDMEDEKGEYYDGAWGLVMTRSKDGTWKRDYYQYQNGSFHLRHTVYDYPNDGLTTDGGTTVLDPNGNRPGDLSADPYYDPNITVENPKTDILKDKFRVDSKNPTPKSNIGRVSDSADLTKNSRGNAVDNKRIF